MMPFNKRDAWCKRKSIGAMLLKLTVDFSSRRQEQMERAAPLGGQCGINGIMRPKKDSTH